MTDGPHRFNLYIDVDGVLLGKQDPGSPDVILAKHAGDFLEFGLENFACFWATTHCRGDISTVLSYLHPYCNEAIKILLPAIRPTEFRTLKTEVLKGEFFWIDDSPLAVEIAWLRERGLEDRWIQVDTRQRPYDLLRAISILKQRLAR